jgi:SAM-dependent methyltransferase
VLVRRWRLAKLIAADAIFPSRGAIAVHHDPGRMVLVGRHAALYEHASGWALGWLYRGVAGRVAADLPPGGRVLDVGTGPGRLLVELAQRRPDAQVVGIDPSADMVERAERRARGAGLSGRVQAQVAAAEDLPFPDNSFDTVVSSLSAHHWADVPRAVAEQARVLRAGGRLWVVDLRGKPATALSLALETSFPARGISRPRLGALRDLPLVCHRAEN